MEVGVSGVSLCWILRSSRVAGGGRGSFGSPLLLVIFSIFDSAFHGGSRGDQRFTMLDFDIHRGTRRFQVEFG